MKMFIYYILLSLHQENHRIFCLSLHELYVHAGVEPITATIILTIPTRINNYLLISKTTYLLFRPTYLFIPVLYT